MSQKREKPPRGVTPGGLRIRLLMKETVRGPLGDSLLLAVCARIGGRRKRGDGEHATAADTRTADRRETEGRDGRTQAICLMPPARDRPPAHDLTTEHGQARLRLRFRRDVEEGEDHGTVPRPSTGAASNAREGMSWLRVDAPYRSGIQLVARVFLARKILNQQTDQTSASPGPTSNAIH